VVVASTNLLAGQVLQRESLKLERMEADKINKAHYQELQGLEGQELMRAMRAGEPIRVSDLRPATLVKRGEMVLMIVGTPATFEISVKAEAMQDGRAGEQIKLRNTESGRTLSAVVTGKGMARGL
jgi:flagella basal body P-ring formation protein FlgA